MTRRRNGKNGLPVLSGDGLDSGGRHDLFEARNVSQRNTRKDAARCLCDLLGRNDHGGRCSQEASQARLVDACECGGTQLVQIGHVVATELVVLGVRVELGGLCGCEEFHDVAVDGKVGYGTERLGVEALDPVLYVLLVGWGNAIVQPRHLFQTRAVVQPDDSLVRVVMVGLRPTKALHLLGLVMKAATCLAFNPANRVPPPTMR